MRAQVTGLLRPVQLGGRLGSQLHQLQTQPAQQWEQQPALHAAAAWRVVGRHHLQPGRAVRLSEGRPALAAGCSPAKQMDACILQQTAHSRGLYSHHLYFQYKYRAFLVWKNMRLFPINSLCLVWLFKTWYPLFHSASKLIFLRLSSWHSIIRLTCERIFFCE